MVVSAAKLEANRRNAQKSTGPRTEEGKQRSSFNAVTHGMRAETLVLPDEDPQALEDRSAAWRACLSPGDEAEQRAVDDAVQYSWMQDRARRAQAARLSAQIVDDGVEEAQAVEREVLELGRRLFTDRLGPLPFYPTGSDYDEGDDIRMPTTSFPGKGQFDPDHPAALVLELQSTLLGCEWLLGEWAKLKATLDEGKPWISSDKLKAVRLLGKQPFDAIDEKDVALVFLASFVLNPNKRGRWYWEILMELTDNDEERFRQYAAHRQLESLKPPDAATAREVLLDLIERATQRLTEKADAHRERARAKAALAADCLAFDDSPAGERLRRHELASGRALARSLETLFKLRRSTKNSARPLSVVSGPLSPLSPLSVVSGPLSVVNGPLSDSGCDAEADTEANAPNEPTGEGRRNEDGGPKNARNEPTREGRRNEDGGRKNAPNEPTREGRRNEDGGRKNALNEPTAVCENVTNEPAGGPLSVVRCPLPVASCAVHATDEPESTNEPTGAAKSVPNEPTGGELMPETLEDAIARIRRRREAFVRALNQKGRKEAKDAMAARRAHRREQSQLTRSPQTFRMTKSPRVIAAIDGDSARSRQDTET